MSRMLSALALVCICAAFARAYEPEFVMTDAPPGEYVAHEDIRNGGVLAEGTTYHRTQYYPVPSPQPCIMPANGAYGWGFPVTTYRWGWFGAEHYWPRVFWFKGYYNDCVRCGYRQGY
jgi:hypothetical protein